MNSYTLISEPRNELRAKELTECLRWHQKIRSLRMGKEPINNDFPHSRNSN
jgi:hypothetical protein